MLGRNNLGDSSSALFLKLPKNRKKPLKRINKNSVLIDSEAF